jgi:hypothetical protein
MGEDFAARRVASIVFTIDSRGNLSRKPRSQPKPSGKSRESEMARHCT